jgi:hypothetical protein
MTLDNIGIMYGCDKASPWHNYCRTYSHFFDPLRDRPVFLLEQGVAQGASIRMWLDYFDRPLSRFYGLDTNPNAYPSVGRYQFIQQDQRTVVSLPLPAFDIIIDDASHHAEDMRPAFEALWPNVRPGGFYCIEDVAVFWDPDFAATAPGQKWLLDLLGEVNHHGLDYVGKPKPVPQVQLTPLAASIAFMHCTRGLVILKKKT